MSENCTEIRKRDFRLRTCSAVKKIKIETILNIYSPVKLQNYKNKEKKILNITEEKRKSIYNYITVKLRENSHHKQYWPEEKSNIFRIKEKIIYIKCSDELVYEGKV